MARWNNKVSPASPNLKGLCFSVNEGPKTVSVTRSFGSLQILAVGVSIEGNSWMVFGVVTLTSSFAVFCSKIRFLLPSGLVVKDCKPVCWVMPQPMFDQQLRVRGEWLLWSSKPCMMGVCTFHSPKDEEQSKEDGHSASMIFYVILFVIGRFASCCLSLVLSSVFLDRCPLGVFS